MTSSSRPNRGSLLPRKAPAVLVAAVSVVGLVAGCGVADRIQHVKTATYQTRAEAPTSGDLAVALPSLVPVDATDITVRVQTQADGHMYSWTSVSGQPPKECKDGDSATARPFQADAWPSTAYDAAPSTCGPLPVHVRRDAQTFYAWW